MAINETLKQKIDDLDLDRRLNEAVEQVERTITTALDKAGGYAQEHREDLLARIERTGSSIDERTDGRFAQPLARAQDKATTAITKLAERGGGPTPPEHRQPM